MIKIHNFHIDVYHYYTQGKNNLYPDLYECPQKTCFYTGRLWRNGFYIRNAISLEGIFPVYIQRYRCPVCGHTVSLIPSFLTPYFQYTLAVIYTCLFAIGILHLSFNQIVGQINIPGFSHQHVSFYKNRLENNQNLCWQVLFSLGLRTKKPPFLTTWAQEVAICGVENFALTFNNAWGRSFMSPS